MAPTKIPITIWILGHWTNVCTGHTNITQGNNICWTNSFPAEHFDYYMRFNHMNICNDLHQLSFMTVALLEKIQAWNNQNNISSYRWQTLSQTRLLRYVNSQFTSEIHIHCQTLLGLLRLNIFSHSMLSRGSSNSIEIDNFDWEIIASTRP